MLRFDLGLFLYGLVQFNLVLSVTIFHPTNVIYEISCIDCTATYYNEQVYQPLIKRIKEKDVKPTQDLT